MQDNRRENVSFSVSHARDENDSCADSEDTAPTNQVEEKVWAEEA